MFDDAFAAVGAVLGGLPDAVATVGAAVVGVLAASMTVGFVMAWMKKARKAGSAG